MSTVPALQPARNGRPYYSTGQIGALCGVSSNTVKEWIDTGLLPGRSLPGKAHGERRVHIEDLAQFLRDHHYHRELAGLGLVPCCLLLGVTVELAEQIDGQLPGEDVLQLRLAHSEIEAGALYHEHRPLVVVLDLSIGRAAACACAHWLRQQAPPPALMFLLPEDRAAEFAAPISRGGHVLRHPVNPAELAALLLEILAAPTPKPETTEEVSHAPHE